MHHGRIRRAAQREKMHLTLPPAPQTRVLEIDALPTVPWRNGRGVTRNLAIEPENAGFDGFIWRVSIADMEESAAFSAFPGVDRTIVLLRGNGMILESDARFVLDTKFEPHRFSGEEVIRATLIDGPARDFNVMVRRGLAEAAVQVWRAESRLAQHIDDAVFVCARGAFQIGEAELPAGYAMVGHQITAGTPVIPKGSDSVLIGALIRRLP